jgi:hypothetical protein
MASERNQRQQKKPLSMTQVPCDKTVLFERTGEKDEIMKKNIAHMQVFSFEIFYELYNLGVKRLLLTKMVWNPCLFA